MTNSTYPDCPKCKNHNNVYFLDSAYDFDNYQCYSCDIQFLKKRVKLMYIICRDPFAENTSISDPSKVFETEHQAQTVAEKMAAQYQRTFYVAKLVLKSSPVKNAISERVDG